MEAMKMQLCDVCGRAFDPDVDHVTDDDVCGASDGPGFNLCGDIACCRVADLPLEEKRAIYTAQRAINDAARAREGAPAEDDSPPCAHPPRTVRRLAASVEWCAVCGAYRMHEDWIAPSMAPGGWAAIGTDGTREVVWGLGLTASAARAAARAWARDCGCDAALTRTVRISADVERRIIGGDVDAKALGL